MSLASNLLSELESIGSFREAGPTSTPSFSPIPESDLDASGSGTFHVEISDPTPLSRVKQQHNNKSESSDSRTNASFAVMERIVERLDSFSQFFQDLRDDFLELRKLWEPVEEIEPKISSSGPGDGFDDPRFDGDNDLDTDSEETGDVEIL